MAPFFARLAGGTDDQPAVGPGGDIYSTIASNQLGVFDSSGNLLRSSFFNTLTAPNVGSDGTIYVGENFPTNVMALNPDLSVKWKLANSIGYLVGPVVDSSNTLVVVGANGIGGPSAVQGIDAATGTLSGKSICLRKTVASSDPCRGPASVSMPPRFTSGWM